MTPLGLLTPGQTVKLNYENSSDVKAGGIPIANVPVGNQFTGYVWIGYCTTIGCASPTNFAKVGAINVKEGGSAFSGGSPQNGPSSTSTSSTSTSSTSTSTTSIHYVAITLTNTQTSGGTGSNFQQMLTVNGIYTGANEINPSWNNVEFTAGNSVNGPGNTILYAWCESGCTNSAASIVWVNLGSDTMAANGVAGNTITIYMNFMPTNVMTSNTAYTGEAPQLYGGNYAQSSYAQYDNGASVFSYYQSWGGLSSLPSGWSNAATISENFGAAYTVFNSAQNEGGAAYTAAPPSLTSYPFVFELYGNMYQSGNAGGNAYGVGPQATPAGGDNGIWLSVGIATPAPQMSWWGGQTNVVSSPAFYDVDSDKVYTITAISSTVATAYENYAFAFSNTVGAISGLSDISIVPNNPGPITAYWIRSRAYPPNGVMPSASLSAVQ